jgi:putative methionine-R-sulfoxide reductase with GAF domain
MAGGIPRPGGRVRRFLAQATPYDIGIAFAAAFIAYLGALKSFEASKPSEGWAYIVAIAILLVLTITKHVVMWWGTEAKRSPDAIESCLHLMHDILIAGRPENAGDPKLRLTVHVPCDDGRNLMQILDYVGDQRRKRTMGRKFPVGSGIIGKAFREKQFISASRTNDNYETYVQEMVAKWGYSEEEARSRDPSTMAWLALPLTDQDKQKVEGIVYLDSIDRDFFSDDRQKLVSVACVAIARYVAQRYN